VSKDKVLNDKLEDIHKKSLLKKQEKASIFKLISDFIF